MRPRGTPVFVMLLLGTGARATPVHPDRLSPVLLVGGVGAGLGPGARGRQDVGGHVVGRVVAGRHRLAVELGLREGVSARTRDISGSVFVGARCPIGRAGWGRLGLAHQHSVAWDAFRLAPTASLLGTSADITHRSGLELGAGTSRPVTASVAFLERVGVGVELSAGWLPGVASVTYGLLDLVVTLEPRRQVPGRHAGDSGR